MINITPKINCASCHGSGFVSGDWVDYESTKTQLPDDFCDCVFEQLPEDYEERIEINIVPLGVDLFNISEIRLSNNDYKEFLKETKEKGFSATWWGVPVVEHDSDSIFVVMK